MDNLTVTPVRQSPAPGMQPPATQPSPFAPPQYTSRYIPQTEQQYQQNQLQHQQHMDLLMARIQRLETGFVPAPTPQRNFEESVISRIHKCKLPLFSGVDLQTYPVLSFLFEAELKFRGVGFDPDDPQWAGLVIRHAQGALTGQALIWLRNLNKDDSKRLLAPTWGGFRSVMINKYSPHDLVAYGYQLISNVVKKGPSYGSVREYNADIEAARLHLPNMLDDDFMNHYQQGLPTVLRVELIKQTAQNPGMTLTQVMSLMERIDTALKSSSSTPNHLFNSPANAPMANTQYTPMEINMMQYGTTSARNASAMSFGPQDYYTDNYNHYHNANQPNYMMHMAHSNSMSSKQAPRSGPYAPVNAMDFKHLPAEFAVPWSKEMYTEDFKSMCYKSGRCTMCREILDPEKVKGGHNPKCNLGQKVGSGNGRVPR